MWGDTQCEWVEKAAYPQSPHKKFIDLKKIDLLFYILYGFSGFHNCYETLQVPPFRWASTRVRRWLADSVVGPGTYPRNRKLVGCRDMHRQRDRGHSLEHYHLRMGYRVTLPLRRWPGGGALAVLLDSGISVQFPGAVEGPVVYWRWKSGEAQGNFATKEQFGEPRISCALCLIFPPPK